MVKILIVEDEFFWGNRLLCDLKKTEYYLPMGKGW